jgi:hypothetical protein
MNSSAPVDHTDDNRTGRQRWAALGLVLLFVLVQGVLRLAVAPLWGHYDEHTHYEYLRYVVTHRALPQPGVPDRAILERVAATFDPDATVQIDGCDAVEAAGSKIPCLRPAHQFNEPPGFYLLQAAFRFVIPIQTVKGEVWLARSVSILLAVAVAWMGYRTARLIFPSSRALAVGVPLVMGANFAYMDLMSSLNNDVAAVAAYSLMVYALVRAIRRPLSVWVVALVVAAGIACFLAKFSAWVGIPLAAVGLLMAAWPGFPRVVKIGIGVAALLAVVAIFRWEPGVGPLLRPAIDRYFPYGGMNHRFMSWYDWGRTGGVYWPAVRWQFVSFWAAFATGVPGLPVWGVALLFALSAMGVIGLAVQAIRHLRRGDLSGAQWRALILLVVAALTALALSLLRIDPPNQDGVSTYIPTARHFYTAIIPTVLLLLAGLGAWIRPAWRHRALAGLLLALFVLNVWSVLNVQIPWFLTNWPIPY